MKKFYALALATLVAVGSAYAESQERVKVQTLTASEMSAMPTATAVAKVAPAVKSMKKAPAKAVTAEDLVGTYLTTNFIPYKAEYKAYEGVEFGGTTEFSTYEEFVVVDDLVPAMADYMDNPEKYIAYEVAGILTNEQFEDGTSVTVLTFAGAGQLEVGRGDGESWYLHRCWVIVDEETGEFTGDIYGDSGDGDVEWLCLNGVLTTPVYELSNGMHAQVGAYLLNAENRAEASMGVAFRDPTFILSNGKMEAKEYAGSEGDDIYVSPVSYPLAGLYKESTKTVTVFGIGGANYSKPIEFVVDFEKNTAVATDQYAVLYVISGAIAPFYVTSGSDDGNVATCDYSVVDGKSTISTDLMFIANWDYGYDTFFQDAVMTFNGDFANASGIQAVEVEEANADAPAVYFNLQGIQVANPVAGQMYIVKQGNQVSKIIR